MRVHNKNNQKATERGIWEFVNIIKVNWTDHDEDDDHVEWVVGSTNNGYGSKLYGSGYSVLAVGKQVQWIFLSFFFNSEFHSDRVIYLRWH